MSGGRCSSMDSSEIHRSTKSTNGSEVVSKFTNAAVEWFEEHDSNLEPSSNRRFSLLVSVVVGAAVFLVTALISIPLLASSASIIRGCKFAVVWPLPTWLSFTFRGLNSSRTITEVLYSFRSFKLVVHSCVGNLNISIWPLVLDAVGWSPGCLCSSKVELRTTWFIEVPVLEFFFRKRQLRRE